MPLIARHLLHVSRLFGAAVLLLVIMGVAAGQDVKLSGVFVDGTQVSGNIRDWHQGHDKAKLAERPIFEEKNPIRWLRNEQIELPPAPKAFVEMFGGDRLPAKVIGYEEAGSGPQLPPQLLVQLEFDPFPIPGNWGGSHKSTYKVRTRWVRRIVWQQRKSDQYLPGTVLFRDGRQLAYRSLRFNDQGVSLLTDSGRETANYGDLAEIHFPRQSTWEAWFDQLAALAPAGNARIVQIETAAGMRLTTSLEQLAVVNGGTPFVWAQRVQPAWSLEPLSLRFTQIACERFFALNELPLSVLEPSRVVRRAMLSGNWPPQVDRNLQGQALASGGASFAWGLGVHAYSELAFELPPLVKSFRTRIGLDQNVGRGGCIRGLIYLNDLAGQPRFDSKFIVGSGQTVDTGEIPLDGPKAGQKQLVLVVDPAHQGRPDGADPLDIRDEADWCEPLFTLDADQLQ